MNQTSMPSAQEREAALFALAVEWPVADRAAFLQVLCGNDIALRQRLEALLAAHDQPHALLATEAEAARPTIHLELAEAADEAAGQTVGRYKLLEQIGEGGYGVVYVAEQTEPVRRRVALKVIKLGMDTKQVVARFEAERQALAMMDDPNIAKVLDAGTTDTGRPYFVMELVRGIKITDYCDQEKLGTRERLELFIKVCQAVQHAHQKGIIHRDIKPSNILVTLHDGVPVPKVIDFGIAKVTEGRLTDVTVHTQLHQLLGTPTYMSPEQAEMSGLDVDTRSDIYSLGVLLYELLTGRTPFEAKELMSQGLDGMRKTIREKEPMRPSTKLATLPRDDLTTTAQRRGSDAPRLIQLLKGDLDWIVMKCLEKDRTRRYETANGLAADLKRYLNNEPVVARPPSSLYRLQKAWKRHRLAFAAGGAVVLALLIGFTMAVCSWSRERNSRRTTVEARHRAEQNAQAAERARNEALAHALTAKRNVYAADMKAVEQYLREENLGGARALLQQHVPRPGEPDFRGWEWRYFRECAEGDRPAILEGHSQTVNKVAFSPDGRYLASKGKGTEPDGNLIVWDLQQRSGRQKWVGRRAAQDFGFARDGRLGVATEEGRLVMVTPGRGEAEQVIWENDARRVLFSPRGDFAAVQTGEGLVQWLDLHTGTRRPAFGGRPLMLLDISDDGSRLCGMAERKLFVWDLLAEKMLLDGYPGARTPLAFLPGGTHIIQSQWLPEPEPRVLDLDALAAWGQPKSWQDWPRAFPTVYPGLNQFAVSRAGDLLAASSYNHYVALWHLPDFEPIRRLHGHREEVWSVAISPDGRTLASGGQDHLVMLWSREAAEAGNTVETNLYLERLDPVFSADGNWLATVNTNPAVVILDLQQRRVAQTLAKDQSEAGIPIRFDPESKTMITITTNEVRRWSIAERKIIEARPYVFPPPGPEAFVLGPFRSTACFWRPGTAASGC